MTVLREIDPEQAALSDATRWLALDPHAEPSGQRPVRKLIALIRRHGGRVAPRRRTGELRWSDPLTGERVVTQAVQRRKDPTEALLKFVRNFMRCRGFEPIA